MKAVAYALERIESAQAAVQALQQGGWGSKAAAGGQSLGAMLNLRLAQPETLIDLDGIAELRSVKSDERFVTFGAMTTHAQIEDGLVPDPSNGLMPKVARGIAYRAVRNRGTLGGSLCHADPAADWVSTMPLLDARLLVMGASGSHEIAAPQFMTAAFETMLAEGELLTHVRVPRRSSATRWSYRKFCRKTGEFAHALAAALHDPADGSERLVFGALDGAPKLYARAGLMSEIADPAGRAKLIAEAAPGLDETRAAMLAEMLRLVAGDMSAAGMNPRANA
jgi:carbon-monoxide dehydrogenase medium subunit